MDMKRWNQIRGNPENQLLLSIFLHQKPQSFTRRITIDTCEGDDNRIIPANDFIASDNPVITSVETGGNGGKHLWTEAEILIKAHKLNLEARLPKNMEG